ncbi:MAG: 3'(2'),5'-bisphosphate nucleotidase CysQ [Candidatus Eutrophobiaceae bacterium]
MHKNIPDMDDLLALCADAAHGIMEIYGHASEYDIKSKDDNSPVTVADLRSHQLIEQGLRELAPDIPVLSEEAEAASYAQRATWQRYWLIDPLDGTREFLKGSGEFSINIALIDEHLPILGVVHSPVSGDCWYAMRGQGAWKTSADGRVQGIKTRSFDPKCRPVIVCSHAHGGAQLQRFLDYFPEAKVIRQGSSLKLCMIAEGLADIHARFGPTSEWDTAAAQCVVEQAGGMLADMEFNFLEYNRKKSLLNPPFYAFGDSEFDWRTHLP